jgi:hypothetical protein
LEKGLDIWKSGFRRFIVENIFNRQILSGAFQRGRDHGQNTYNIGKMRIDAGELELRLGREELILVKKARVACVIGAFFFTTLSIFLGFLWKRSLARIFMHKTARFRMSS